MKHELYQNGKLIALNDNRSVADSAELALALTKQSCKDAIEATGISWMVERELSGGKAVPDEVKQKCALFRSKSNETEKLIIAATTKDAIDSVSSICDEIEGYVSHYIAEINSTDTY
jgi:hypothetical protein